MDYELNQEQQILKDAAHNFFLKECPSAFVRQMMEDEKGYTVDLWKKMAAQGWMGLLIPEAYGGTGGNFLDMAVLLYEAGYACLPGPFFSTAVLGSTALIDGGSESQKKELLPQVSKGDRILTVAWTEGQGTYAPQAILTRAVLPKLFYLISGTKLFVPDAHVADTLICAVRTQEVPRDPEDGISLSCSLARVWASKVNSLKPWRETNYVRLPSTEFRPMGKISSERSIAVGRC